MKGQRVMLIRARPGSAGAVQALDTMRRWKRTPGGGLIFFHGPGLGHAAVGAGSAFAVIAGHGWDLRVCQAGWRRRNAGPPPTPFAPGSLVQFWDVALEAAELCSFGDGGDD
ncbi:MAG: hypothetical protein ACLFSC_01115 [Wenzhouxiangella sp.]